jgi:hypothetical protein
MMEHGQLVKVVKSETAQALYGSLVHPSHTSVLVRGNQYGIHLGEHGIVEVRIAHTLVLRLTELAYHGIYFLCHTPFLAMQMLQRVLQAEIPHAHRLQHLPKPSCAFVVEDILPKTHSSLSI